MSIGPNIKWAVSSISLGKHTSHTLERKIEAAALNGLDGIEIVFNEVLGHATTHRQDVVTSATDIGEFARSHSIVILSLNAFKNFEGNTETSLEDRLLAARIWVGVALALGTKIIQVPSMFLSTSTGDEKIVVSELQALADLAAQHDLEIAYEAVAFAKHNALWQDSLRIAKEVDRSNFRICLDSYHIHARLWGDACTSDGLIPGGREAVARSLREFLRDCPDDLVSYMQLSDASRWDPPLALDNPAFDDLEIRDPRLLWSRCARPFPLEDPGYFPVAEIAKTWLIEYGWDGWMSLEGFLTETLKEDCGPEIMAKRARQSIDRLLKRL